MQRESFNLKCVATKMITPSVRHLAFEVMDNHPFEFTPGQFVTFHFTIDDKEFQRSYSIASIPTDTKHIEIAASPFPGGPGTTLLFGIQPGEVIATTGPFGRLILRDEQPKRLILVATGTGVTPYRAMLPELAKRIESFGLDVVILLGVQNPEDLLYGEDFIRFASQHPKLTFHAYYSRSLPANPQSYEHQGYVQSGFDELNLDPENDVVYLCGNPNMIDDAFKLLKEKGFATQNVRREKYISPKK